MYGLVLQIHELNLISCNKHVSCIELHELSANKRVIKADKFQFYMHPVTVSLLNNLGDACSMDSWVDLSGACGIGP